MMFLLKFTFVEKGTTN